MYNINTNKNTHNVQYLSLINKGTNVLNLVTEIKNVVTTFYYIYYKE